MLATAEVPVPFDPDCRLCSRLVGFLEQVRHDHLDYHCAPVPAFGPREARLLIVGLAPGMHGANATGRPFTGDHAGILLYETLYRFGFASTPRSVAADDGLRLLDCRITNAVRCLPPQNKPTADEVRACRRYLCDDLCRLPKGAVVLALGALAHKSVVAALGLRQRDLPFSHAAEHVLPGGSTLVDSYHCSRYNTQTGRLTAPMFEAVFARLRDLLDVVSHRG